MVLASEKTNSPVDRSKTADTKRTGSDLVDSFGLSWLVRLRWVSLVGQLIVIALSVFWLKLHLPLWLLAACLIVTFVSNLAVQNLSGVSRRPWRWVIPALLGLDVVSLTIMLYFTGGAHNPFSSIYILHLTVAAMLLPTWMAWTTVAICGIAYSTLFQSKHYLINLAGERCCNDLDFHLTGMWVALVITASGVAYFVTQLRSDRERHRSRVARLREREDKQRRFASLATLTAGVAHELATPLSTLAIISKDLELQAEVDCHCKNCHEDAALMRQEIDRCRMILQRMNEQSDGGQERKEIMRLEELPEQMKEYLSKNAFSSIVWNLPSDSNAELIFPKISFLRTLAILIKNANEASLDGSPIDVSLALSNGIFTVMVEDSGCGITAENLDRIGEPFFTTKPPGSGMGLGLFIVRSFVDAVEGEFDIRSSYGKGCTVTLRFPIES